MNTLKKIILGGAVALTLASSCVGPTRYYEKDGQSYKVIENTKGDTNEIVITKDGISKDWVLAKDTDKDGKFDTFEYRNLDSEYKSWDSQDIKEAYRNSE